MAKATLKTQATETSVTDFLQHIADEQKRTDCIYLMKLMQDVTGASPKMWGPSIIGYGEYTYQYDSGRSGDWFLMGFSPRKQNITLYVMTGYEQHPDIMQQLGKYKTGKSCLYINRMSDVNKDMLHQLLKAAMSDLVKMKADFASKANKK
jgi:hypothetical protein